MAGEDIKDEELDDEIEDITADTDAEAEQAETEEPEVTEAEAEKTEEPEETEEAEKEEKTSFFKKKKDKRDEQIADLNDRVKRQMAEFENFRKRSEKEKSQMYDYGARAIVEKILPVVDNFERGLSGIPEGEGDAFAEGMRMTYKQLVTALTEAGVTPIEALGQEFNPDLHNAVMHVEDEEAGENMVVEEFQKGYKYHDIVVRHSMVKVAN